MHVWLLVVLFLIHWESNSSSKIEINRCLTPHGFEGSCRPPDDCESVEHFEASDCPHDLICCPHGEISRRKCYEYSELVYGTDSAVNLMANRRSSQNTDQCAIIAVPLIIGGEKVQPKEFPHQALLGYGEDPMDPNTRWECGGSLISEIFVLTAAHCVLPVKLPKWVRLGIINLEDDEHNQQIYQIRDYILHPKHNAHTRVNDVALLKLTRKVVFTPYVRPACLDYNGAIKEKRAIATGFGLTSHVGEQSLDLLKVQLDILNKDKCKHLTRMYVHKVLQDSQMCAGTLAGGKDTCQGDSGGPLQTIKQVPYCMYSIIGVTSYGAMCGFAYSPAIYSRVWSFIPWIEDIVWPNY